MSPLARGVLCAICTANGEETFALPGGSTIIELSSNSIDTFDPNSADAFCTHRLRFSRTVATQGCGKTRREINTKIAEISSSANF